jgi:hypothetical protein
VYIGEPGDAHAGGIVPVTGLRERTGRARDLNSPRAAL